MRVEYFVSTVLCSQELRVGSLGSGVRHSFPTLESAGARGRPNL